MGDPVKYQCLTSKTSKRNTNQNYINSYLEITINPMDNTMIFEDQVHAVGAFLPACVTHSQTDPSHCIRM